MRRVSPRAAIFSAVVALGAVAAATRAESSDPGAASAVPDATLTFHGRTATIGVGFAWGASTLEFHGQTYPVRVDGFVLGGVGTSSLEGVGQVFGLTKVEDLNGDYTALATGAAFGRGKGTLVMRNDKGVRVVLDVTASGLGVGIGPRGITLSVGEAGGPPADAGARLPQTLGFGELRAGPLWLRPTFNAQAYVAAFHNPGFEGDWSFGPTDQASNWVEHSNELGLNLRVPTEDYGTLLGRVSGVYSLTAGGPDGPVCNGSDGQTDAYTLESAYLAWRSADLLPSLGYNALEISGGNQNYQVFDGLLFWDGGQDCGGRGANWLSPRKAFRDTAIVRLTLKHFTFEAVHLQYNDHPDTATRLAGARVEYATDDGYLQHLKLGLMYFDIYHSDAPSRDGLNGVYLYGEAAPLRVLPDLTFKGSYVHEGNNQSSGLSSAFGWYGAVAYQLSKQPWTPQLGYRYASFSGGGRHAFDSLFTGLPEWGSWFQGETLGEFVLSNSNLNSHQVRLTVKPNDVLTANLIYYHFFMGHQEQSFGLTTTRVSRNLADEVDAVFDLALTNWWSMTATLSVANPNRGFQEAVGGSSTWFGGYLYTNFNF